MKKFITTIMTLAIMLTSVFATNTVNAKVLPINNIKCNVGAAATIRVHQTLQLQVEGVKAKKVKWKTSNKKIATVSKKGLVIGKRRGTVTISAKVRKKTYKCKLRVKKANTLSALDIKGSTLRQGIYLVDELYNKKNIIISPMSLNMVLGMVANGTVGNISPKPTNGRPVPTVYINPKRGVEEYLGKSTKEYNQYALKTMKAAQESDVLKMANAVWYQENCKINDEFKKVVEENYYATVKKAAFNHNTLNEINNWAKENTDGMIDKILKDIDAHAYAYLLNALLFDGKWTDEIDKSHVYNGKFTKFNGKKVKVKMMQCVERGYYENDYAIAFEKTYGEDKRFSFIGILPKDKGNFELQNLNIKNLLKKEKYEEVDVVFPKFSYKWRRGIQHVLYGTSLNGIFIHNYRPLRVMFPGEEMGAPFVEEILQACKINVDEKGTKAAAVTATIIKATSVRPRSRKKVVLDRPFAYLIRDNESGDILFAGKVVNPSVK